MNVTLQMPALPQIPFWQQPTFQAALVNVAVVLVVAIIGWVVTARIAKLTRGSASSIAEMTTGVTRQQLEVAQNQYEVNRQNLVLSLLPRRIELKQTLFDAIDARGQEINTNNYQTGNIKTDALHALWRAGAAAKVLFGDDVTKLIDDIGKQLNIRDRLLLKIRTDLLKSRGGKPVDHKPHDEQATAASRVEELKGELSMAIDRYSAMGDVRMVRMP